jgi:glycerol-3-phosphate acyltransferase PlsY
MDLSATLIAALGGYLLGSLMFAIVLSRLLHGTDIRAVGSRNPGFTNVFRELGTRTGVLTLAGDILKGFVAVALARWVLAPRLGADPSSLGLAAAIGALLGHSFPLFFRFRGGKGVATVTGAFLGLAPAALGVASAVWALVLAGTRYMSVASMSGAVALAACLTWAPFAPSPRAAIATAGWGIAAAIVLRHRSNLSKLRRGEERRFSFKRS